MKLRLSTGVALLIVLLAPLAARAELSQRERDTARSMIAGTLYLRLDVPCRYGRGRWAIARAIHHVESLLEKELDEVGRKLQEEVASEPKGRK